MKLLRAFHSPAAWPAPTLIACFIVFYGGLNLAVWLVGTVTGYPTFDLPEMARLRKTILQVAAVAQAGFHLWRFHPACNRSYAAWLRLNPWTADKPLPLGPIWPVWQDALVIAIIAAVAKWHAGASPAIAPVAFGFGYLAGMTLLFARNSRWGALAVLGFLWPTLLLPALSGWPTVAVVLAMIAVVWIGVRNDLRAFPWPWVPAQVPLSERSPLQMNITIPVLSHQLRTTAVGWPLVSLSPKFDCPSVPFRAALAVSLLTAWWFYCLATRSSEDSWPPEMILPLAFLGCLVRVAFYTGGSAPPSSIFGRIASGSVVLPKYDVVFVTPLLAVLLALLGTIVIRRADLISPATVGGLLGAVVFVLLSGGPVLRTWLLTGDHRFRAPSRHFTTKQSIKPI